MSSKHTLFVRFLEFFVIGIVFGLGEDLVAIKVTTGAAITFEMVMLTLLIALPFAIFTELIVDHPSFWHKIFKHNNKKS